MKNPVDRPADEEEDHGFGGGPPMTEAEWRFVRPFAALYLAVLVVATVAHFAGF